eukprot:m.110630 g.110630  ORF g.110630 m.110630 type:complete len:367 (+) comp9344_c0_seq2:1484-2584(+)
MDENRLFGNVGDSIELVASDPDGCALLLTVLNWSCRIHSLCKTWRIWCAATAIIRRSSSGRFATKLAAKARSKRVVRHSRPSPTSLMDLARPWQTCSPTAICSATRSMCRASVTAHVHRWMSFTKSFPRKHSLCPSAARAPHSVARICLATTRTAISMRPAFSRRPTLPTEFLMWLAPWSGRCLTTTESPPLVVGPMFRATLAALIWPDSPRLPCIGTAVSGCTRFPTLPRTSRLRRARATLPTLCRSGTLAPLRQGQAIRICMLWLATALATSACRSRAPWGSREPSPTRSISAWTAPVPQTAPLRVSSLHPATPSKLHRCSSLSRTVAQSAARRLAFASTFGEVLGPMWVCTIATATPTRIGSR